jgi:hypothetical protein
VEESLGYMALVASWIAACRGIGVDRVLNSICGQTEEVVECADFLSEFDDVVGFAYRAQIMLSAVSDCIRVSVLCCPYTVSGIPAILYRKGEKPKTQKDKINVQNQWSTH